MDSWTDDAIDCLMKSNEVTDCWTDDDFCGRNMCHKMTAAFSLLIEIIGLLYQVY